MEEEKISTIDKLVETEVSQEMRTSFLDYSMSVIIARAIPDLRDGLKPVHRRILYAMYDKGVTPDKPYKKSAEIVGEVMGKFHPHGDSSIYEAMVRMTQEFTYRYPIVDGHGGFGTIDGDPASASRYTEAKLQKIALEMTRDINKNTIDFAPTYTNEGKEPVTLPSRFPNILVNGNMGIAVGMATNIPPHNLGEVIDGCIAYIDNPEITTFEMMEHIKGPDFPTYGTILGNAGIIKAYETGRGTVTTRARAEIVEKNNHTEIIFREIPYQVNKKDICIKIGELVREKIIEGISDIVDESSLEGIKLVIVCKREANANVILNNLYKHTQLQSNFGINFLMLLNGRPMTLGIVSIVKEYIHYQNEIIIRRTKFELDQAERRAHILEGLKIALDNIDAVIKIIRNAKTDAEAKEKLMTNFKLTDAQTEAILEMKLRRLTGLEKEKIEEELNNLIKEIARLKEILADNDKVLAIIKEELTEIKNKYADSRRTEIDMTAIEYIEDESLIPVEEIVITLTSKGYIKRVNSETYRTQNRGGVGIKGMTTNEEDYVEKLISMTTHDYLLFFSNRGKVYRMKGYEIPLYNRQSKGLPIINLLPLDSGEIIKVMLMVQAEDQAKHIVLCTQNGLIKRTNLKEFDSIRSGGKIAITIKDEDELIAAKKTIGENEILIASTNGRMIRFSESEIRVMGRTAAGVRGINVGNGKCVGCEISEQGKEILVITEKGYGKKTAVEEYRMTHRGSKGVKALNITEKNGNIVSFKSVDGHEDLIIVTNNGIVIRMSLEQVSSTGRVAQGVRLINLKDDQKVSSATIIEPDKNEELSQEDISEEV